MLIPISDDNQYFTNLSTTIYSNDNSTNDTSYSIPANTFPTSFLIILILSVLCLFGVCFMMFGPLQRSQAYKNVENFTFGHNPIFNIDHREQSSTPRYDDSMEFLNI